MRFQIDTGRFLAGVVATIALALLPRPAAVAQECGTLVVGETVLGGDLVCPLGHGLVLAADAVLDCAGHGITGGGAGEQYGVYATGAPRATVRNCVVRGFEVGIRVRNADGVVISDNAVHDNWRYGVEVTQGSVAGRITGNEIFQNGDEGIHVSGPPDIDDDMHEIAGNAVYGNDSEGIYLFEAHGNTVSGNRVWDHGAAGIYVKGAHRNRIEDNILINDPLQLVAGARLNAVARNLVAGTITAGLRIEAPEGTRSTGNGIVCNRIVDNAIGADFGAGGSPNTLIMNVIADNEVGVDATGVPPDAPGIDATLNWWGCVGGPTAPGCNPAQGNVDVSGPATAEPACVPCATEGGDADADGACTDGDNCPATFNLEQADTDADGAGNLCDPCTDTDADGYGEPGFPASTCAADNCPGLANPTQNDLDADAVGDACDPCTDTDADGFTDPGFPASTCALDTCPLIPNPDQADADTDGLGDACDPCTDPDGDGFGNAGLPASVCPLDNCSAVANPTQSDLDADGFGDACDPCTDSDADGFADSGFPASTCGLDTCPLIPNPDQADADDDGIGDACECGAGAPGRCLRGGGSRRTDCLLEFNATDPAGSNGHGGRLASALRCTDGDPACDRDRRSDGRCTFGVAVCLGNDDPRLPRCRAAIVEGLRIRRPRITPQTSEMDRTNVDRLRANLLARGVAVESPDGSGTARPADTLPELNSCGSLVSLSVPAPATGARRPATRTIEVTGRAADGRRDRDRLRLVCFAAP